MDPYAGKPRAVIPDGTVEDIDEAVGRPPCGIGWAMGQMAGFDRARLMRRFADLIADNAERPARVEVHDSGKPTAR
jgi:acyl-CoA reductase-like NAD-dependent aldehyde dehydrogenase